MAESKADQVTKAQLTNYEWYRMQQLFRVLLRIKRKRWAAGRDNDEEAFG